MMKIELSEENKLTVECRVEGGCLGPKGDDYVDGFCDFVSKQFSSWEADLLIWQVVPRHEKSLSELQYKLQGRNLSRSQAKKYLESFGKNIDELEAEIDESLIVLIEDYMSTQ